jgi:hypothetical protein
LGGLSSTTQPPNHRTTEQLLGRVPRPSVGRHHSGSVDETVNRSSVDGRVNPGGPTANHGCRQARNCWEQRKGGRRRGVVARYTGRVGGRRVGVKVFPGTGKRRIAGPGFHPAAAGQRALRGIGSFVSKGAAFHEIHRFHRAHRFIVRRKPRSPFGVRGARWFFPKHAHAKPGTI